MRETRGGAWLRTLKGDVLLAVVWLTRLPVGRFLSANPPPLAQAAWAFPLVGLILGLLAAAVYSLAHHLGLSPLLAALMAVGVQVWLTGGLHEDGLADFADGMGATTPARRLEIMRDSRIGSYGALTLGLVSAMRIAALAALPPGVALGAFLAIPALSRAGMVVALGIMAPARRDGLGQSAGRPSRHSLFVALGLGVMLCAVASLSGLWPGSGAVFAVLIFCAAAQIYVGIVAIQKLGGQTGDVLGAMQLAGETAALIALSAVTAQIL